MRKTIERCIYSYGQVRILTVLPTKAVGLFREREAERKKKHTKKGRNRHKNGPKVKGVEKIREKSV